MYHQIVYRQDRQQNKRTSQLRLLSLWWTLEAKTVNELKLHTKFSFSIYVLFDRQEITSIPIETQMNWINVLISQLEIYGLLLGSVQPVFAGCFLIQIMLGNSGIVLTSLTFRLLYWSLGCKYFSSFMKHNPKYCSQYTFVNLLFRVNYLGVLINSVQPLLSSRNKRPLVYV